MGEPNLSELSAVARSKSNFAERKSCELETFRLVSVNEFYARISFREGTQLFQA